MRNTFKKLLILFVFAFGAITNKANAQVPTITSFSPLSAKPGDAITITGTNFNSTATNDIVFFGATQATVTAATATSLTVTVPIGAVCSPISVLNVSNGLSALSKLSFIPNFSPAKTSFSTAHFAASQKFTSSSQNHQGIVTADFDGDGKPDIAVTSRNSSMVSIYKNTSTVGSISVATNIDSATGAAAQEVLVGDIDGDGKLDIVVGNSNAGTISVFKNTSTLGSISFATKIDLSVAAHPEHIALGDINGDGKLDIAASGYVQNKVSVFKNTSTVGNISFAAKADFATGSATEAVKICDIDGDNKPDIIASNFSDNTISVLRNTGSVSTISFAAKVDFDTSAGPQGIAIGDIDGDGKIDIVTANYSSNYISILLNTSTVGTVSMATKVEFITASNSSTISVAVGDINGDGIPDIVSGSSSAASNSISVFINNSSSGTLNLASAVGFSIGDNCMSVCIADLDGDSKPEILSGNLNSKMSILKNVYPPSVSVTGSLSAFTTCKGSTSSEQSFTVSGSNLTSNITVTAPTGFEVSITSGSGFISSVTLTQNSGSVTNATIYARLKSTATGTPSGNITCTSTGSTTQNVAVSGTVNTGTFTSTTASNCNSYVWSKNGQTYTTSGTYFNNYNNANGCASVDTLKLTIKQPSTPITVNTSICSGGSYVFDGVTYTTAGSHTATFTNAAGCDSTVTVNITLSTPTTPGITISAGANNVCVGTLVSFTANATNGGASPAYQWKLNGNNIIGANSNTYQTTTLANNDVVSCVLTANNSCQTTATANSNAVKMIMNAGPNIGVSTGGVICTIGGTRQIHNTNTNGGGVWTTDNPSVATITTSAGASGTATAVGVGTAIMTYTKTNLSNGCKATAIAVVTVAPASAPAAIGGATGVCRGATAILTSATPGGVWSCGNISTATIDSVTGVVTGKYQGIANIKYTVTNAYGCINAATLNLPVYAKPGVPSINYLGTPTPQAGAIPSTAFCRNKTFSVTGSPTGGVWSSTDTSVVTVTSSGVVYTAAAGLGSVIYTYTDINGCSNSRALIGTVVNCPSSRGVNASSNEQVVSSSEFTMYPNPAKTFISLSLKTLIGSGSIVVTDLYGKQVKTQPLSMGNNTVDIANLSKGFYLVSIITEQVKTTKKLVVE